MCGTSEMMKEQRGRFWMTFYAPDVLPTTAKHKLYERKISQISTQKRAPSQVHAGTLQNSVLQTYTLLRDMLCRLQTTNRL